MSLLAAPVVRVVPPVGDELVEVVEALVVSRIGDDAAVAVDDRVGALVLEAPHGGALDRHRERVVGVELDHPAEAVGLVGLLRDDRSGRGSGATRTS